MSKTAKRISAASISSKAAKPGQAGEPAHFQNSFTAKDRLDLLQAAFKSWPLDTDPDVVPVLPIPSVPAGAPPVSTNEQTVAWWVWAKENIFRKSTVLKSAIALLVAVTLGWVPLQRLLATTSVEAIINAHVINIRTPIAGEVSAAANNFEIGKEFHAGDELLIVRNPQSDDMSLNNLERQRAQLATTIATLQAKKRVLEIHHRELTVQKERYRTSRIEQLEKRIREIKTQIASADSQHGTAAKISARARELFAKSTVSEAYLDNAERDDRVSLEAANGLKERRDATQIELAAAQKGTFVSDGYNDTSESAQRGLDVELQLADVDARLAGTVNELANVKQELIAETKRHEELSTAVIRASISGRVWEIMTAPGEHVNAGQELIRLLDCDNAMITANVSETTYQKLTIGQLATFKPSDGGPVVNAWIVGLSGLAAVGANDAVPPKALSGAPYHVKLKFTKQRDRKSDCQISRPGLVTFDTTSSAAIAKVSDVR